MPGARELVRWAMAVSEHALAADDIGKNGQINGQDNHGRRR